MSAGPLPQPHPLYGLWTCSPRVAQGPEPDPQSPLSSASGLLDPLGPNVRDLLTTPDLGRELDSPSHPRESLGEHG